MRSLSTTLSLLSAPIWIDLTLSTRIVFFFPPPLNECKKSFVSSEPDTYQIINGVRTLKEKGIKGMGNKQMIDWAKSFVNYAQPWNILIMDNLSSHLNDDVTKFLASYNITVLYLPVRCASILSPLDNSFFSILKRRLASSTAVKPYQDAADK